MGFSSIRTYWAFRLLGPLGLLHMSGLHGLCNCCWQLLLQLLFAIVVTTVVCRCCLQLLFAIVVTTVVCNCCLQLVFAIVVTTVSTSWNCKTQLQHICKTKLQNTLTKTAIEKQRVLKQFFENTPRNPPPGSEKKTLRKCTLKKIGGTPPPGQPTDYFKNYSEPL